MPKYVALDADKIAKDLGNAKAANIVVLGAAAPFLGLTVEQLENAIKTIFKSKGQEVVNINIEALRAGLEIAQKKAIR